MKNVHYLLLLFHRQTSISRTLPYNNINLKFSCWSSLATVCWLLVRKGADVEWRIFSLLKRRKVTSRRSVLIRVLLVSESHSFLNNAVMSSLIRSSFGTFALFIAANPSAPYKPTTLLSIVNLQYLNDSTWKVQQARKFRLHYKILFQHSTNIYFLSLPMWFFYRKGQVFLSGW